MTDGNAASRKELLHMEVREFYGHLSVHEEIIDKRMKEHDKLRNKKKKGRKKSK